MYFQRMRAKASGAEGPACAVSSYGEAKAEEESCSGEVDSKKDEGWFLSQGGESLAEVQKGDEGGKRKDQNAGLRGTAGAAMAAMNAASRESGRRPSR